jgi:Ca2+-binding RTX toxin-like protein
MTCRPLRASLGTCAVVATVAAMMVGASRAEPAPDVSGSTARGALSISNSKAGHAILRGTAMRPGSSVSGTVTIANSGDGDGLFELSSSNLVDVPGTGRGRLSERLRLLVEDISDTAQPVRLYDGSLEALSVVPLGEMRAGERRTYRLTGSLRTSQRRGADNAYEQAASEIEFDWAAHGIDTSGSCANRILGSGGAESLTGSRAGDRISAGAGNDSISGRAGRDCLYGEAGDDTLNARDGGPDAVDCGSGSDVAVVDAMDHPSRCEQVVRAP